MGYLYVMRAGDVCKIGITNRDVKSRMQQIQTGCPKQIEEVWCSKDIQNARECEKILHNYFRNKRTSGEWFAESFEMIVHRAENVIQNTKVHPGSRFTEETVITPFMTIEDAAKASGLSVYFIRQGIKNGLIPHIRCGCKAMVNYNKMLQELEKMEVCANASH